MGKSINVQNIHMAEVSVAIAANGAKTYTFGVPEPVAGAMKINRVPQVAEAEMYEDGKLSEQISQIISHNLAADLGRLPQKWRAWINGLTVVSGVVSDKGPCTPKPFAMGWEVEHIKNNVITKEMIWYIYCLAKPIEDNDEQRKKDITISNDTVNIVAFKLAEYDDRAYTIIDTSNADVTEAMETNFFSKVQTTDTIAAPVVTP